MLKEKKIKIGKIMHNFQYMEWSFFEKKYTDQIDYYKFFF